MIRGLLLVVVAAAIAFGGAGNVNGQAFTLPGQVEISVAPGFNHTPIKVAVVTNTPGLDLSNLVVASDSSWVTAVMEPAAGRIALTLVTSNLVNSLYTATITARLGGTTNTMFVRAYVSPLNIFKLKDDPFRSRTYGVQQNGVALGSIVVLNPVTTNYIGNITVGRQPTDMAVSRDGTELLVLNCADKSISVIDLATLALKETLPLLAFDNWGVGSTTANIAVGPANVIYYTDGAWAPALRVLDRRSMNVLQTVSNEGASGSGFGDIGLTSDNAVLFGWMQYGWSAGLASSYVTRFGVAVNGLLTFLDEGPSQYSSLFQRDPLETPVLVSVDNHSVFIKGFVLGTNSASDVKASFPGPVYSISPGGEIAVTASSIYETATGLKLADLPLSAPVQTISSDYARLIYFDSGTRSLRVLNLLALVGPEILKREVVPTDHSITLAPTQLRWTPLPGVDRYRVYLGQSQTAVAAATTNSPLYLGEVNQSYISVAGVLLPGVTYFWRVDATTDFDVTPSQVYQFTVSTISCSVSQITTRTVQGHANLRTTLSLQSEAPGQPWTAAADRTWIGIVTPNGATPATLELVLDASALTQGVYMGSVTISSGTSVLFSIPVTLAVDPLRLTVLRSDPLSQYVYAISEDTSAVPPRAYLLEVDSLKESIERVTPVGSSATDLAVHNGDNRLYVPNWMPGGLYAIDKTSFQVDRFYTFAPFGGVGYSQGDIYRVAAGAPGRLVWEEEDQWIDISIFDTAAGTNMAGAFVRQGGGGFGPGGRYYYHGDDNSSGAEIHKFDVIGDRFAELAHIRVASWSYYGSRTVVVSEDGSRVFWNGSVFNADLSEEWTIGDEIYSCSADGRYAFGRSRIYDIAARQAVLGMPTDTGVSAFNSTSHKLVVQINEGLGFYEVNSPPSLPAPILSAGSITPSSLVLNWTDRSLENSFTVQRRVAGSNNWTDIASLPRNTVAYTNTELSPQTTYEFRIKADGGTISSDWSAILAVTTPGMPPSSPVLNTPVATLTSVSLSWSDAGNEEAYVLERSVNSSTGWLVLTTLQANSIAYTDLDVTKLTTYYYRIRATNAFGSSAYSVVQNVTVPAPQPPAAPTGLLASPLSSSSVKLAWNDVADETSYIVQRRTEDPTGWRDVATVAENATAYSDTNLVAGMQYFYRVQALNANGGSAYSTVVSVVPVEMVYIWQDDFDPDLDPLMWAQIAGGVATNGIQGFRSNQALYFAGTGSRSAATIPLDVSQGGTINFFIRAGNETVDGNALWNNSEIGESIVLEFSKDSADWFAFQTNNTIYPSLSTWTAVQVNIPPAAFSPTTQFRWRQLANSGPQLDCWALDEARIWAVAPTSPGSVPFVIASADSASSLSVFWVKSDRAASYDVQRKTASQPWTTIASVSGVTTYYIDAGLMPETAYSYQIIARNAGGAAAPSPTAAAFTWTQMQGWLADNYGSPDALTLDQMIQTGTDGSSPLLRYAFNLAANEPLHILQKESVAGMPRIWLDSQNNRLSVEFVRRNSALNPGITYQAEFCDNLINWTVASAPTNTVPIDSVWERVRFQDSIPANSANARFCRISVKPN